MWSEAPSGVALSAFLTLGSSNASLERQRLLVGSNVSVQPNFGLEGRQAMTVSASHGVGRGLLDIIAYLVSVV